MLQDIIDMIPFVSFVLSQGRYQGDNSSEKIPPLLCSIFVVVLLESRSNPCFFTQLCEVCLYEIIKVERDEEFIAKLKAELDSFCLELALTVKKLKELAA